MNPIKITIFNLLTILCIFMAVSAQKTDNVHLRAEIETEPDTIAFVEDELKHLHNLIDDCKIAPTCTHIGYHNKYCITCGRTFKRNVVSALGHKVSADWKLISEPSHEADGIEIKTCVRCGEVLEEKSTSYNSVVAEQKKKRWIYGRFIIPDVGVNVAIIQSSLQSVCDAEDSACYWPYEGNNYIADHHDQGFEVIKQCKVGTESFIYNGENIQRFVCVETLRGHNTTWCITRENWQCLSDDYQEHLITYTCDGCWQNIAICIWKEVSNTDLDR